MFFNPALGNLEPSGVFCLIFTHAEWIKKQPSTFKILRDVFSKLLRVFLFFLCLRGMISSLWASVLGKKEDYLFSTHLYCHSSSADCGRNRNTAQRPVCIHTPSLPCASALLWLQCDEKHRTVLVIKTKASIICCLCFM